ncbi:hypothetical protein [Aliiglaciecola sp. LCG003]|uniref:hypothetical protein n=1 Tax=Aliiglaciecola sp. LCG003 TaxID=3053655 RepID=UPI002573EC2E|nr:hypothetical protein [Aliiglaciecola sp. LCG003]WJG09425.1 hypothetical protein QR722_19185 [Aliiglaciecola sp. LCG003]
MKILILLFSNWVLATEPNMCPINKNVAEDMRILESDFTKERAESATKLLAGIIDGSITSYSSFNVYNAQKLVTGFILKKNALDAAAADKDFRKKEFCSFMEKSAWWYD